MGKGKGKGRTRTHSLRTRHEDCIKYALSMHKIYFQIN